MASNGNNQTIGVGNGQTAVQYRRAAYLATYYRWSAARFTRDTPMGNDPATGRPWGRDLVAAEAERESRKAMARVWSRRARELRGEIQSRTRPVIGQGWTRTHPLWLDAA